ncbi:unnamed protein product [Haemonchus placei]|uniref:DUF148 domain-containing protein n=1 Tax=Haemonchus placei TaxID=6290 RepID=A0A0N4X253_HAEPC|nr:unnamed protein product [Haemonchus placei]
MRSALFLLLISVPLLCLGYKPRHHREECHTAKPKLTFLRGLGRKARAEFCAIKMRDDVNMVEQKEEIMEWAKKHGVEKQVEQFNKDMESYEEELNKNVTQLAKDLPAVLEKYIAITMEKNQTRTEMRDALKELKSQQFEVFGVLKEAFEAFKPDNCPRRKPHKLDSTNLLMNVMSDDAMEDVDDDSEEVEEFATKTQKDLCPFADF